MRCRRLLQLYDCNDVRVPHYVCTRCLHASQMCALSYCKCLALLAGGGRRLDGKVSQLGAMAALPSSRIGDWGQKPSAHEHQEVGAGHTAIAGSGAKHGKVMFTDGGSQASSNRLAARLHATPGTVDAAQAHRQLPETMSTRSRAWRAFGGLGRALEDE